MFKINDYVVYGGNGVCKVLGIGTPSINGADKERQYYRLKPIYENGSIIYTPVDNEKVVMRRIISKEEAKALINNITSMEVLYFEDDKMRQEKYKEVMHTYDCMELIKIIKTSYLRKEERLAEGKRNTATDDKYLKMAEECLYGEFAIALDMPKDQVKDFIIQTVENMGS
ncbi:transcriptional regulator, CarD family [Clostridium cavendishii DSM 21758]|uniref:Transcriptional regulator, CarD family n=1 Tax=Clostridium cavendishii DSM 21758 TaxID=1121302 RepID=A0A1M6R496_9CLOT|nr:CarD family transcriptional regulator [Clostridium cavendishii]SHK27301.1 transcriptional regulator, CarD family [Clostridium cavendishii DSM 21758]